MKKIILLLIFLNVFPAFIKSQENDLTAYFKNFKIGTYIDTYYAYDNDKNIFNGQRTLSLIAPFRDQFRINIAQLSLKYNTENIRGAFIIHYGDIPDVNWKPVTKLENIQEANIGFSLYKNLWIDAGYFITHVGAEGLPKNNILSSFALPTYIEPFIQSGVKIGYDFSDKFTACFHLLNGYNLFEDNNKNKSVGLQLIYSPTPLLKITYNNIIGNEMPAGMQGKTRVFNNLIINASPCKKIDMVASIDIGIQEKSNIADTSSSAYSYGVFLSTRYKFTPKFSTTVRGEYYQDLNGILSGNVGGYNWLKGNGITIGCEYRPVESAYLRFEYRYLRLDNEIKAFYNNSNQRFETMLSAGFEY